MDLFSKSVGASLLAVALAAGAMMYGGVSDRERFDQLQVGMSIEEVNAILQPPSRRFHARPTSNVQSTQNINFNGHIKLKIRGGRLVSKQWIE